MKDNWVPAWVIEKRTPGFLVPPGSNQSSEGNTSGTNKYLWGNMPAIDILNLHANEGMGYEQDLTLLFAGMSIFSQAVVLSLTMQ